MYFAEMYSEDCSFPVCAVGNTPEMAFYRLREFCDSADFKFDHKLVVFYTAQRTTLEAEVTYTIKDNP